MASFFSFRGGRGRDRHNWSFEGTTAGRVGGGDCVSVRSGEVMPVTFGPQGFACGAHRPISSRSLILKAPNLIRPWVVLPVVPSSTFPASFCAVVVSKGDCWNGWGRMTSLCTVGCGEPFFFWRRTTSSRFFWILNRARRPAYGTIWAFSCCALCCVVS